MSTDLGTLLRAWRTRYELELGEQIEALGPTLGTPLELPEKQGDAAKLWAERVANASPEDISPLLAALGELLETAHGRFGWPCVEVLASLEPDPRIAAFALRFLSGERTARDNTAKLQRRLLDLVERHADRRVFPALDVLAEAEPAQGTRRTRLRNIKDRIEKRTQAAAARRPEDTPSPADEADGEQLLAAIYEDPDDDGRRIVYADWLLERDGRDPRGELITLQMQRAAGAQTPHGASREKAIIEKHAARWYKPIWKAIAPATAVFEKGFLARCELAPMTATKAKLGILNRAEWATVREVRVHASTTLTTAFRGLRAITNLSNDRLADLDALPLERLDKLGVALLAGPAVRFVVERMAKLPIAELVIDARAERVGLFSLLVALLDTPHGAALRAFTLENSDHWQREAWAWDVLDRSALERLVLARDRWGQSRMEVTRDRGVWNRMTIHMTESWLSGGDVQSVHMWEASWGPVVAPFRDRPVDELVIASTLPPDEVMRTNLWRVLGPAVAKTVRIA